MKIAIITIATGKYDVFVNELVESCRKYFLPDEDKKYFIFTDSPTIKSSEDVVRVDQKKLGWPFDTMMRFHMFLTIQEELKKFDFIFFMNSNLKIVSTISRNILPLKEKSGLVVTYHPGFYKKHPNFFTYERNPESNFYIPEGEGKFYAQGCFNGGRSLEFLEMSRVLKEKIDLDLDKKIIPVWHDESALNWYVMNRDPKILHPVYSWPEFAHINNENILSMISKIGIDETLPYISRGRKDPHSSIKEGKMIKIIQRDKNLFGGKTNLRE